MALANQKASLYGRTAEYGGQGWTDSDGNVRNDGVLHEGVIIDDVPQYDEETETYAFNVVGDNDVIISARNYWGDISSGYGAGAPSAGSIVDNSYVSLGELSLSYNVPREFLKPFAIQNFSLSVFARNVGYLYKTAPDGLNPRSNLNGGKLTGLEFGGSPITRTIGFGATGVILNNNKNRIMKKNIYKYFPCCLYASYFNDIMRKGF